MSWNGNNDNKDPWGREGGPPDIDEAINKFKEKISSILGGSSGGSGPGFSKKNMLFVFHIYQLNQQYNHLLHNNKNE